MRFSASKRKPGTDSRNFRWDDAKSLDHLEVFEKGQVAAIQKAQATAKTILAELADKHRKQKITDEDVEEWTFELSVALDHIDYSVTADDWPLEVSVHWSADVTGAPVINVNLLDECLFFDLRDLPNVSVAYSPQFNP